MTTWTRAQVEQVRGLRARVVLDPDVVRRAHADVLHAAREKMSKRLVDMAHSFAVEPHLGDFLVREGDLDEGDNYPIGGIEVVCWWQPDVRTCEVRGGAIDGTLLEVEGAPWRPLMAMDGGGNPWSEDWVEPRKVVYEMTGWSEDRRHWIYEGA